MDSVSYLFTGGRESLQDDSLHLLTSSQAALPPHLPQTQQGEDTSSFWRAGILHLRRGEGRNPMR